jgi:hypothetical protein
VELDVEGLNVVVDVELLSSSSSRLVVLDVYGLKVVVVVEEFWAKAITANRPRKVISLSILIRKNKKQIN